MLVPMFQFPIMSQTTLSTACDGWQFIPALKTYPSRLMVSTLSQLRYSAQAVCLSPLVKDNVLDSGR